MSDFPSLGFDRVENLESQLVRVSKFGFDRVENLESQLVKKFLPYHKIQFFVCLYAV